jgi:uncharacterized membrane protein YgcG
MGKVVMIVSLAVTAFMLIVTAGAIYAYRDTSTAVVVPTQPAAQAAAPLQMVAAPAAPTVIADVSPQDAASIAAKFLNRTDLYSVELADLQGVQTYKITFTSGDVVYVGLKGQVISSAPPPAPVAPAVVVSSTGGGGGGGGHHGGGGSGGGGGEGDHEGGGD